MTGVPAPGGGDLVFDQEMRHFHANAGGWTNWSNGYTGDVCYSAQSQVAMTLLPSTYALYFYTQPGVDLLSSGRGEVAGLPGPASAGRARARALAIQAGV